MLLISDQFSFASPVFASEGFGWNTVNFGGPAWGSVLVGETVALFDAIGGKPATVVEAVTFPIAANGVA